jgi:hypothetical protein
MKMENENVLKNNKYNVFRFLHTFLALPTICPTSFGPILLGWLPSTKF